MSLTLCLNVFINRYDICVCEIIVWLNSEFKLIHIVIEQNQCKYKPEKASYYILIENDSQSQHNNENYEPATYFKPFYFRQDITLDRWTNVSGVLLAYSHASLRYVSWPFCSSFNFFIAVSLSATPTVKEWMKPESFI